MKFVRHDGLSLLNCTAEKSHAEQQGSAAGYRLRRLEQENLRRLESRRNGLRQRADRAVGDSGLSRRRGRDRTRGWSTLMRQRRERMSAAKDRRQGQTHQQAVHDRPQFSRLLDRRRRPSGPNLLESCRGRQSCRHGRRGTQDNHMTEGIVRRSRVERQASDDRNRRCRIGGLGQYRRRPDYVQSDHPAFTGKFEKQSDFGTMALALLGKPAEHGLAAADKGGFAARPAPATGESAPMPPAERRESPARGNADRRDRPQAANSVPANRRR